MEFVDGELVLNRELSELDRSVVAFVDYLTAETVSHVIVSGYVAILTGRSRGTEDVDIIIERLEAEQVDTLLERLDEEGYWCINADRSDVYTMLQDGLPVRFAEQGTVIPNFEVTFPTDEYDRDSLTNSIPVRLTQDDTTLRISPLELQIAYKLYLGAEKDFEDALHLYQLFKESLDNEALEAYVDSFDVGERYNELRNA